MNIEVIKSETESHFRSEGKEDLFNEKVLKTKDDIITKFWKWKTENPGKEFSEFKNNSVEEVRSGMQFLNEIFYVGIFLTAMDLINPEEL